MTDLLYSKELNEPITCLKLKEKGNKVSTL